jgi:HK97 family phage portal protein
VSDILSRILARANGKAMAELHPEIFERTHVASLRSDTATSFASYSYLGALSDYESHVWVRKAIKVIADNLCSLPLTVKRDGEEVAEHAIARLLTDVNDQMSSADVWQQWCVDMMLGGEEGWELVRDGRGNYVEIWPRQPHTINVTPDPKRKRYYQVAYYSIDDGLGAFNLPPEEFVHFKFYNPSNPWRGIAPISAVRTGILIDVYAQAWSKLFFQKSARPDYALIAPQGITKSERLEYEKMLAAKFGGMENAHKPVVLEQGVTDIKFLDFRPRDLEWIEQRKISREEVGAIFGVPDEIMGWGRDTYENFDTAHWVLWMLTILPLAAFRDTHLTEYFRRLGALKPDEQIVTNTSQVGALKKDLKSKIEMLDLLARWGYPVNVASSFLGIGLPQIDGGDTGYLPLSLVPVTSSGNAKAAKWHESRERKTARKAVEYDSDEHRKLWDVFVKRTDPWERKLGDKVADLMRAQEREVLARLHKTRKETARDVADDPFDRAAWERRYRDEVKPILRDMVKDAGQAALDDLAIDMAFDVLAPEVVEFLKQRGQRFAKRVNETTWQQLKDSLREGLKNGESIPDLAKRVEEVMGARIRSSGEVIARTEVIGASNGGTLEAWKQSEVVATKTWLAALDNRTRDSHIEAHGQTVALDENFEVGSGRGPAPGQIGLPEEDIQCRCAMTAGLKKAVADGSSTVASREAIGGNGHGRFVRAVELA